MAFLPVSSLLSLELAELAGARTLALWVNYVTVVHLVAQLVSSGVRVAT